MFVFLNKDMFYLGGLVLGENCYVNAQCTGTTNSGVCLTDHQDNITQICQCDSGFIRYNDRCLQGKVNRFWIYLKSGVILL